MTKLLRLAFMGSLFLLPVPHAFAAPPVRAQTAPVSTTVPGTDALARDIRIHLEFLASDALGGRGSGTENEHVACEYVAAQLKQYGIQPAGDLDAGGKKTYVQAVPVPEQHFTAMPQVSVTANGAVTNWTHGREVLITSLSAPLIEGGLQHLSDGATPKQNAVVLTKIDASGVRQFQQSAANLLRQGASAVLVEETPLLRNLWKTQATQLPQLPRLAALRSGRLQSQGIVIVSTDAARALRALPEGTPIRIGGAAENGTRYTYNVIGVLPGSQAASKQAVLFSAHIDHLGTRPTLTNDDGTPAADIIYNGADDDASGVVAVLEMARTLSQGASPKRTVYFACFGSEESGGAGARAFLEHPPTAIENIVCNLEFEMIGRPDPKIASDALWLAGFERSNLGLELQKQGARIVADPHPEQNFFSRSDNIQLARRGVVAHTVSSFGLHPQYHQPDDDLAHIDFDHLTRAIASLLKPAQYLVNSDFVPAWVEGKRP